MSWWACQGDGVQLTADQADLASTALTEAIEARREVLAARSRSADTTYAGDDYHHDSAVVRREVTRLRRLRAAIDPTAPA